MAPPIVLIDTSVLCHLVRVHYMGARHEEVKAELLRRHADKHTLLLPWVTIVETGNHIAQNGNGHQRRAAATRLVELVRRAQKGELPFAPTAPPDDMSLHRVLDGFVEAATRAIGYGDLCILDVARQQRLLNHNRPVEIWSFDQHLSGA